MKKLLKVRLQYISKLSVQLLATRSFRGRTKTSTPTKTEKAFLDYRLSPQAKRKEKKLLLGKQKIELLTRERNSFPSIETCFLGKPRLLVHLVFVHAKHFPELSLLLLPHKHWGEIQRVHILVPGRKSAKAAY